MTVIYTEAQLFVTLKKEYTKPSSKNPYIWIYKSEFTEIPTKVNPKDYYINLDYKPTLSEACANKKANFKNGGVETIMIPVVQYDLNGNLLNKFYSLSEAHRQTGVSQATIRKFLANPNYISTLKRTDKVKFIWKFCDKNDPDVTKTKEDMINISDKK